MDLSKQNRIGETIELLSAQLLEVKSALDLMNSKIDKLSEQIMKNERTSEEIKDQVTLQDQNYKTLQKIVTEQHNEVKNILTELKASSVVSNHEHQALQSDHIHIQTKSKISEPNLEKQTTYWLSVFLKDQRYFKSLKEGSKIVTSLNEENTIKNFFDKQIKSLQLVYRASEHNFSVKSFHDKCDSLPNTLVLIETSNNKKIGGFTPLTWQSTEKYNYKRDESEETFIFSLTHADKLYLKENSKAIVNSFEKGPMFGGEKDLVIVNNANTSWDCYAAVCKSFSNPHYLVGCKESIERFTGNPYHSENFTVKEWEVWRVIEFESDEADECV